MAIKTTSLETSKALKEAGFRQDADYIFRQHSTHKGYVFMSMEWVKTNDLDMEETDWHAAPTTDELLSELPKVIEKETNTEAGKRPWHLEIHHGLKWEVLYRWYYHEPMTHFVEENESLPEALAQMYLFLRKEGLIKGGA